MQLTQKETMLLQDLKNQEQICIEKYRQYAARACDEQLKTLFANIESTERSHLDTLTQMMEGTIPMQTGGQSQNSASSSFQPSNCDAEEKQTDEFLCGDALSMEKHVSSVYDVSIFEFGDAQARETLNHIQKEEQQHGLHIYDYMSVNGMSA